MPAGPFEEREWREHEYQLPQRERDDPLLQEPFHQGITFHNAMMPHQPDGGGEVKEAYEKK